MTGCIVNPRWRQFVCRACGRLISDCRPAGTLNDCIPTVEEIDSCAVCYREKPSVNLRKPTSVLAEKPNNQ
jgi:methionyl-tRNA synthetase